MRKIDNTDNKNHTDNIDDTEEETDDAQWKKIVWLYIIIMIKDNKLMKGGI
jgi:hypothetical protein